jgi:uncharacterized membrane protein (DUF106 family)
MKVILAILITAVITGLFTKYVLPLIWKEKK